MTEWQPIDKAPKDGTRIIAYQPELAQPYNDEETIAVVAWIKDDPGRHKAWCIPESYGDEQGSHHTLRPTHFMLLPPPPRDGE
jgi:hypothetical protein